jgi:DNA topoisomerase VI subunit B
VPEDKAAGASRRAAAGPVFYRVTVADNGKGMSHEDIPNMLGRVLSGTKYGVRQARGKFGLGAKMVLIWAKQTTGQPIEARCSAMRACAERGCVCMRVHAHRKRALRADASSAFAQVRSAPPGQAFVSVYSLDLDLRSNAPAVRSAEKERNEERWHGTRVSVLIRGAWATYGARIVKYLRQLAVITPYAAITFRYTSEAGGRSDVAMRFARRTGHMPPPPQETMHHPAAGTMRCAGHGSATRTRCVR